MLRRTPLRRKKGLAPGGRLKRVAFKRSRAKPNPNPAGADEAYKAWIRRQPCALRSAKDSKCYGDVQAHHITVGRGLSQKVPDRETMPLCTGHHMAFHRATGIFANWTRDDRRGWQRASVAYYQGVHAEERAAGSGGTG